MKRIPLIALQKSIYEMLTSYQDTPVYDDVPEGAKLPYITLGAFTCKNNGTKSLDMTDVSLQIHIWSEYSGKAEVNSIGNDVITIFNAVKCDLNNDNFHVVSLDVDFFEAFPEDIAGYHGVCTIVARVQNLLN